MNFIILFLFFILNINFSFCFVNLSKVSLKTNRSLMIDQNILPDFTNALIVNGIGYTVLKESNQNGSRSNAKPTTSQPK